ncbi:sigma-54-dependent Fis family transcriptional regulator [Actinomycetospora termitidis]|uniref:Helix-turn-helix domain-containing protein n=1 Tax=Actinomycetospora termitidis TaxID=3053470 RepID=A0ABT7M6X2_9PSEU|nr:helix-turn-helix domain-containing protein [Actinomycetospora sp. Odt1-22]MDL5155203.1 helix-turn-helix domain-containing protein [Actinomycetospora sp. Odt1-22]
MDEHAGVHLDRARERFLGGSGLDTGLRPEIMQSWERSLRAGVDADELSLPYDPDLDFDGSLVHFARPVLDDLAERLSGMSVAVVLSDADGNVLDRRVGEGELQRRLDAISLAPGFSYAEEFAGTNGVGTALEGNSPAMVIGAEHYTDRLRSFACAGAPVHRPGGVLAGILDVTCLAAEANDLMRFLARQAARDIEEVLRERGSAGSRAVMAAFRVACARVRGPVLALADDFVIANRAADDTLSEGDRELIARYAAEYRRRGPSEERALLDDGPVRLLLTPAPPERPAGVVVEVVPSTSTLRLAGGAATALPRTVTASPSPGPATSRERPLAGLAGTTRSWRSTSAALRTAATAVRSTLVLGETGVGKLAAVRAAHREIRPAARLVVVDGDGPNAAEDLLAVVDDLGEPATVVVRRLESLDDDGAEALAELLADTPAEVWIVGSVTGDAVPVGRPVHDVLGGFAGSLLVEPLRRRPEDVAPLVDFLLARLAPGRRVRCTAGALALLGGARWPGNVAQLSDVLRRALASRPAGDIEAGDLPAEVAVHGTRRRLTPLETAERDLIVAALIEARGNRVQAAAALGMGRATLYRRLRAFGITDVGR